MPSWYLENSQLSPWVILRLVHTINKRPFQAHPASAAGSGDGCRAGVVYERVGSDPVLVLWYAINPGSMMLHASGKQYHLKGCYGSIFGGTVVWSALTLQYVICAYSSCLPCSITTTEHVGQMRGWLCSCLQTNNYLPCIWTVGVAIRKQYTKLCICFTIRYNSKGWVWPKLVC